MANWQSPWSGHSSTQSATWQRPAQTGQYAKGSSYDGLANAGLWLSITGSLVGAVGSGYEAVGQQHQLKTAALDAEFAASQSALDARAAERDAQAIMEAGQQDVAMRGLQEAQDTGAASAAQAASGTVKGVGNAAEVQASIRLAAAIDKRTLKTNTQRRASAERMRAVNAKNRASMLGVSAQNMRDSAGSISPALAAGTSLLGSAGPVGASYASYYGRR